VLSTYSRLPYALQDTLSGCVICLLISAAILAVYNARKISPWIPLGAFLLVILGLLSIFFTVYGTVLLEGLVKAWDGSRACFDKMMPEKVVIGTDADEAEGADVFDSAIAGMDAKPDGDGEGEGEGDGEGQEGDGFGFGRAQTPLGFAVPPDPTPVVNVPVGGAVGFGAAPKAVTGPHTIVKPPTMAEMRAKAAALAAEAAKPPVAPAVSTDPEVRKKEKTPHPPSSRPRTGGSDMPVFAENDDRDWGDDDEDRGNNTDRASLPSLESGEERNRRRKAARSSKKSGSDSEREKEKARKKEKKRKKKEKERRRREEEEDSDEDTDHRRRKEKEKERRRRKEKERERDVDSDDESQRSGSSRGSRSRRHRSKRGGDRGREPTIREEEDSPDERDATIRKISSRDRNQVATPPKGGAAAQAALAAIYEKQGFSELAQQTKARSLTEAAKEAEQQLAVALEHEHEAEKRHVDERLAARRAGTGQGEGSWFDDMPSSPDRMSLSLASPSLSLSIGAATSTTAEAPVHKHVEFPSWHGSFDDMPESRKGRKSPSTVGIEVAGFGSDDDDSDDDFRGESVKQRSIRKGTGSTGFLGSVSSRSTTPAFNPLRPAPTPQASVTFKGLNDELDANSEEELDPADLAGRPKSPLKTAFPDWH
jgi:hypothetical protein